VTVAQASSREVGLTRENDIYPESDPGPPIEAKLDRSLKSQRCTLRAAPKLKRRRSVFTAAPTTRMTIIAAAPMRALCQTAKRCARKPMQSWRGPQGGSAYVINDVQRPITIPASAAARSKIPTLGAGRRMAIETSSSPAAAAPPHKTHRLGSNRCRATQRASVRDSREGA
jgi:hypothetical protein